MKKGAEGLAWEKQQRQSEFIKKAMDDGIPPNMIIVLDTHSDSWSGELQTAEGSRGVPISSTLPQLVKTYVGDLVLKQMKASSAAARSYNALPEVRPGVTPWADITPKTRGGWRVLVMAVCGSSVRQPVHWNYLTQLFEE